MHKTIKKFINGQFYTSINSEFNLENAILDAVEYHNNKIHTSTLYTPIQLKDTTDIDLISKVKENIKELLEKNNEDILEKGDKLLINNNIEIQKSNHIIRKNKNKGKFIIPAIFKNYCKNKMLNVTVVKNFKYILSANTDYLIKNDLVRIVDDDGFNYCKEIL